MLGQRVRDPLSLLHPSPEVTTSDRAASSLLSRLQQKKQERWEEAVNSIDFSHSSRKAWRTINKLTGRSGRPSRLCPVSENSITPQLEERGTQDRRARAHQARQQTAVRPMKDSNSYSISELFRPKEFAAALRRLKPGKSQVMIPSSQRLYAGPALKSWFCDFLNSFMRQLKIPKIWRRALVVAILKPEKPLGNPKSYRRISLLCVPFTEKSSRDSSTLVSNQSSTHCSHRSRRASDSGGRP